MKGQILKEAKIGQLTKLFRNDYLKLLKPQKGSQDIDLSCEWALQTLKRSVSAPKALKMIDDVRHLI